MRVWMLCEAFTLLGDDAFGHHQAVHESLEPWALPCQDKKTAMRELRNLVKERVLENCEGLDDADEDVRADVRYVFNSRDLLDNGKLRYRYSADDREVVWQIYPCEVMGT